MNLFLFICSLFVIVFLMTVLGFILQEDYFEQRELARLAEQALQAELIMTDEGDEVAA